MAVELTSHEGYILLLYKQKIALVELQKCAELAKESQLKEIYGASWGLV